MKAKITGTQPRAPKACTPAPELEAVQNLMPISTEDKQRLYEAIRDAGEVRDPIRGYTKAGKFQILSGYNRWEIASELGLKTIPTQTVDVKPKDRADFAIRENLDRRHLTREQKQKLIEHVLKINPGKTNRQIAKETGSSHNTVQKQRERLESVGQLDQQETRTGAGGKQFKAQKPSRSKPTPKAPEPTAQGPDPEPPIPLWQQWESDFEALLRKAYTLPAKDQKEVKRILQDRADGWFPGGSKKR